MTAQDLKNAILQLAVQGKLVPQDPNDEPASELLKRIKVEKERLLKEGKVIIDKKHTPSHITEDDIPYDLPETWSWVRFADIVTFYSGKTPERNTASYWSKGEYTWVSIADMVPDGITVETKERITHEALTDCFSNRLSPAGTMIMSFKLTIGKVSILGVDAVHNEAIISVFPFLDDTVLKGYLFKTLPLVASGGDSKNAIKGKTLNATSLSNLMIPLPPLAEQQRIVAKIEELMPLVEEYGKAEERLTALNAEFPDKLRKSILQQAIQGKLTERDPADEPASELLKRIRAEKEQLIKEGKIKKEKPLPPITEEEIPFEIPENWVWTRLGKYLDVRDGTHDSPKYVQHGFPLVTSKNLKNGDIEMNDIKYISKEDFDAINERSQVDEGDILFAMIGSIGNPSIVGANHEYAIKNVALFKRVLPVNETYVYFFLLEEQDSMKKKASGGVQPFVSLGYLRNHVIPLPPLAEQQRIVDRVNELLAACDELK